MDRPNDRVAEAIVASVDRRLDGYLLVDVFHLQVRSTLNLAGIESRDTMLVRDRQSKSRVIVIDKLRSR